MSYHEIEVVTRYWLNCNKCGQLADQATAGAAERVAREHIEEDEENRYGHIVNISTVTLVGRQP